MISTFVVGICTGVVLLAGKSAHDGSGVGVTTVNAAPVPEAAVTLVEGEPARHTEASRAAYVPRRVALRDGRFDVLVHFHGTASNQEKNVDEAGLSAVVVSVNEGVGTTPYAKAVSSPSAFDAILGTARRALVKARGREDVEVGRIALSSWSAGGGAVRVLLEREPERFDAVLVADGLFSTFAEPGARAPSPAPLAPFVRFAKRAQEDAALFVLTHTDIDTPDYPSTPECTAHVLEELGLDKDAPRSGEAPLGGEPTYAVDAAGFHVRGFSGKGPDDHIAQIRGLDRAYAILRARWEGR